MAGRGEDWTGGHLRRLPGKKPGTDASGDQRRGREGTPASRGRLEPVSAFRPPLISLFRGFPTQPKRGQAARTDYRLPRCPISLARSPQKSFRRVFGLWRTKARNFAVFLKDNTNNFRTVCFYPACTPPQQPCGKPLLARLFSDLPASYGALASRFCASKNRAATRQCTKTVND